MYIYIHIHIHIWLERANAVQQRRRLGQINKYRSIDLYIDNIYIYIYIYIYLYIYVYIYIYMY